MRPMNFNVMFSDFQKLYKGKYLQFVKRRVNIIGKNFLIFKVEWIKIRKECILLQDQLQRNESC